jgi:hypothetical protein
MKILGAVKGFINSEKSSPASSSASSATAVTPISPALDATFQLTAITDLELSCLDSNDQQIDEDMKPFSSSPSGSVEAASKVFEDADDYMLQGNSFFSDQRSKTDDRSHVRIRSRSMGSSLSPDRRLRTSSLSDLESLRVSEEFEKLRTKSTNASIRKLNKIRGELNGGKLEKLAEIKSAVFDAKSPKGRCPPTDLELQVAERIKSADVAAAREAERSRVAAERRRSIAGGELLKQRAFSGGRSNVEDRTSAKERREAYGNKAQWVAANQESLYHVGRSILNSTSKVLRASRSSILFVDKNTDELFFFVTASTCFRFPLNTGVSGWVYRTGAVANIPKAYEDNRFNKSVDKKSGFKTENILAAPIIFDGDVVAVLQFLNKCNRSGRVVADGFSETDGDVLVNTATKLSAVVGRILGLALEKKDE